MRASEVLFALRTRKSAKLDGLSTTNTAAIKGETPGRILAIDLGAKRVGVAVCDELRITVRPVGTIERRSWKDLLKRVRSHVADFEARALVIGLPLNIDGSEGQAAVDAREVASKFRLSLSVPVYLQDERLTSEAAKTELGAGETGDIDSRAAAIILQDFLSQK